MYTMHYRTKYDAFCFNPFIPDLTEAKILYLKYLWWGCKAVQILDTCDWSVIWETSEPVIHPIDNPDPDSELPF